MHSEEKHEHHHHEGEECCHHEHEHHHHDDDCEDDESCCEHEGHEHHHHKGEECCHHEHEHHHHEESCSCGHSHGHHHSHGACSCGCGHEHGSHEDEKELTVKSIVTAGVLFLFGLLCEHLPWENILPSIAGLNIPFLKFGIFESASIILFFVAYIICGKDVLVGAVKNILRGRVFDELFLMAVASLGAILLKEYAEASAIMILYQIGEKFEDYAVDKSHDAIEEIAKLRPDTATLKSGEEILAEKVKIGSIIIVKPGERIPIDGNIVNGETFVDTSALTGESLPRHVRIGDEVLSGSINKQGVIEIETTKKAGDSALARILELVENASENKTKSEQFVTRFAKVYTPIVTIAAALLAVIPPLYTKFFMPEYFATNGWGTWIYRALEFLVVSCPCALVISIPLSFCGGITACAKRGILIKGSTFIEALAKTKTAVFDKTGTLTKGNFIVTDIHPMNPSISKQELIAIATHAELLSNHPISASLRAIHHEQCCEQVKLEDVEDITSKGIKARVNGKNVLAGNASLMEMFNVSYPDCPEHQDGTIIHVACDGEYAGHIVISDEIKDDSASTIEELKKIGVEKVVMLTGDNDRTAKTVAERLGIHKVYGQMMSKDKLDAVEKLMAELSSDKNGNKIKKRGSLIFTGDGINDAPVLARADAGIAMGAMGSDAAVEAGDVIIMEDKPSKIVEGIKASRRTLRIVYENLYGSLGIKGEILILSALGITNMWLAVFGDVGVTILAVLNSLRLLRSKKENTK
ncbi:MAG: heavy metal translocating P-type ATPase [Treponema sp.]|nr:heavy metal translocating P-type ATPase [Treponema sp.]